MLTQLYYQEYGDENGEDRSYGKPEYQKALYDGYFYNAEPHGVSHYTEFYGIVDYWVYIDEPYLD